MESGSCELDISKGGRCQLGAGSSTSVKLMSPVLVMRPGEFRWPPTWVETFESAPAAMGPDLTTCPKTPISFSTVRGATCAQLSGSITHHLNPAPRLHLDRRKTGECCCDMRRSCRPCSKTPSGNQMHSIPPRQNQVAGVLSIKETLCT